MKSMAIENLFFCYKAKRSKGKKENKNTKNEKTKVYGTTFPQSLKLRDMIILLEERCEQHTTM